MVTEIPKHTKPKMEIATKDTVVVVVAFTLVIWRSSSSFSLLSFDLQGLFRCQ